MVKILRSRRHRWRGVPLGGLWQGSRFAFDSRLRFALTGVCSKDRRPLPSRMRCGRWSKSYGPSWRTSCHRRGREVELKKAPGVPGLQVVSNKGERPRGNEPLDAPILSQGTNSGNARIAYSATREAAMTAFAKSWRRE